MFGRKKNKFDGNFIKQKIMKVIINEHLTLLNLLKDEEPAMGKENRLKERANIEKMKISTAKEFNSQYDHCLAVASKVEILRHKQRLRRQKILDWVENYCLAFDEKEEKSFILKISKGCNEQLLKSVLVEAEIFDLSDFNEEPVEEVEDFNEDLTEEYFEDLEEGFKEDNSVEEDNETDQEQEEKKDEKSDIENIVNS